MINTVDDAIRKMNEFGRDKIPFLFLIDFEMEKPIILKLDEVENFGISFSIGEQSSENISKEILFNKYPVEFTNYQSAFNYVIEKISSGYSYLTNLTFPTRIETNLSLQEIFQFSSAQYKLMFNNEFVVFSPESFVKIEDGQISSYPMKGTMDAGILYAEEIILNDEKETAEHITIVDLIRNDLSIVSENVHVEKFRYIEKIKTNRKELLQVSSKIVGELKSDYNARLGEIIFALLPAGSVSGAPKKKTVEIIRDAEKQKRGYYTGIFGCYDGERLDSAVMIRFIENMNGELFYRSGGGITFMSNAEAEYQELIDKVYVPINRSN